MLRWGAAWHRGRGWVLGGLAAVGLAACTPTPDDIIRQTNTAGAPPSDLSTFFNSEEQKDPTIWTADYLAIEICGTTSQSCIEYESEYLPRFFDKLGTVRYSEPVKRQLTVNARVGYSSKSGIAERWLTCFSPEESERLYYFYSRDGKHAAVNSKTDIFKGGTIFYVDPNDPRYTEALERCGPLTKTTRIVLPPA